MDSKRAYFWSGEKFTRLLLGSQDTSSESINLLIYHQPMKRSYASFRQYVDTMRPILQEEWKWSTNNFTTHHSVRGDIVDVTFIEKVELEKMNSTILRNHFGLIILVPENGFWNAKNLFLKRVTLEGLAMKHDVRISKLLCTYEAFLKLINLYRNVQVKGFVAQTRMKGNVLGWTSSKEGLLLQIKLFCDVHMSPLKERTVLVEPKPDKTNYASLKHTLLQLSRLPKTEDEPMVQIFVRKNSAPNWSIQHGLIELNTDVISTYARSNRLMSELNPEQVSNKIYPNPSF